MDIPERQEGPQHPWQGWWGRQRVGPRQRVRQHPLQNFSFPCEVLLKCILGMSQIVLAGGSGRCWQIWGKKRIFIASGWSAWHWPQQGSSFHYRGCGTASVKITGNAKSALEMIQTEICSRHGHCGEPTAGRDSKTEAMFLSFFLQMSNLMVLNGRRDRAGKNQRSEINSSKHQWK